jgi:hypothetical protein
LTYYYVYKNITIFKTNFLFKTNGRAFQLLGRSKPRDECGDGPSCDDGGLRACDDVWDGGGVPIKAYDELPCHERGEHSREQKSDDVWDRGGVSIKAYVELPCHERGEHSRDQKSDVLVHVYGQLIKLDHGLIQIQSYLLSYHEKVHAELGYTHLDV